MTITAMQAKIAELRFKGSAISRDIQQIIWQAQRDGLKDIPTDKRARFDDLEKQFEAIQAEIIATEEDPASRVVDRDVRMLPGGEFVTGRAVDRKNLVLRSNERLADYVPQREGQTRDLSFGKWLKGSLLGDWRGADEERALSIGTPPAGAGFLVPTPLAAGVIDLARNAARVMQAGASTVRMEYETLKLARQTSDVAATWRAEAAPITTTDLTFDVVTLTAHTLAGIVRVSRELVEDAANVEDIIRNSFARSIALEIDRVALYGAGTATEPLGLSGRVGVPRVSLGVNGAAITNYDPFVDAILAVELNNFEPNAAIFSPRTQAAISKFKDSQGNPLRVPQDVADLTFLDTKQIPINRTKGTATTASDVFLGDFSQLLMGMRTQLQITMLTERFADTGEIGLVAWLRADVATAHDGAFAIIEGVVPAP